MDSIFFLASKIIWALISPDSLLVILGMGAWISLLLGWQQVSRNLLALLALLLLLIGSAPVGEWLIAPLETRFQANAALPAQVDGVIVLGAAVNPQLSDAWGQTELESSADRLTAFAYLASLYPQAQLVYTGGSASVAEQEFKEADYVGFLLAQIGLGQAAIIYESASRNTAENVSNSKPLVNPQPGQNWILVTSAYHMPRAIGVFCQQQWPVHAYPVDHHSQPARLWRLKFRFAENLVLLRTAMREWAGLIAYRVSGRSDRLLASDSNQCLGNNNMSNAAQSPPI
ncbi:MAG: YdcF family protein [Proteobacteria bacterium]|nr:YdcF family protein [Pseudomonadota bacterium]MDA0929684.1 YdcF family protein [Pseudomonadota bacterium]